MEEKGDDSAATTFLSVVLLRIAQTLRAELRARE